MPDSDASGWLEFSVPADQSARLAAALAASLVLHVAAFTGLVHFSPGPGGSGSSSSHSVRSTVQARLQPLAEGVPAAEVVETSPETSPETPPVLADNAPPAPPPEGGPRNETGLVPLPQPYYHSALELDQRAMPKAEIMPPYPDAAGDLQGFVVLRLLINEAGKVDETIVVRSEPEGIFDSTARDAFGGALFTPGIKNGIPVKSQMMIEVRYRREETAPHPASAVEATKPMLPSRQAPSPRLAP